MDPPEDNPVEDVPEPLEFSIGLTEEATSDGKSAPRNKFILFSYIYCKLF